MNINRIIVLGERCSGTNYLRRLLGENFGERYRYDESYDELGIWKHGFNPPEVLSVLEDTLFVVIVRNVYDWCRSLYRRPHHFFPLYPDRPTGVQWQEIHHLRKGLFSAFIRKPVECYFEDRRLPEQERDPVTLKPFGNLLELRNAKNRYYLNLNRVCRHLELVTHEEICRYSGNFLKKIAMEYGLKATVKTFRDFEFYTSGDSVFRDKVWSPEENAKYVPLMEGDRIFIEATVDWQVEGRFGYEPDEFHDAGAVT